MNSPAFVRSVTKNDFTTQVIERSQQVLVVADFWAAWCQPCQMLMPVLARLAEEYQGRFELAKIDTEQERELAAQQGIRSLPTVRLYRHGRVVDEFLGAQPEGTIRGLIDRHLPRPSDATIDAAMAAAQQGKQADAIATLRRVIADDPDNDRGKLVLANLLIEAATSAVTSGQDGSALAAEAEATLGQLGVEQLANADAIALKHKLGFLRIARGAPSMAALEAQLAADGGDIEARHQLGALKVLKGDVEGGLEQFLEIVHQDRKFGDDAGRRAMVDAFSLLGNQHPLVSRFRSRLSSALN